MDNHLRIRERSNKRKEIGLVLGGEGFKIGGEVLNLEGRF